jgi:hypothetical protein
MILAIVGAQINWLLLIFSSVFWSVLMWTIFGEKTIINLESDVNENK